jgi:DNA-directed RNA polymerase subunit RPC12/RpoP
MKCDNCNSKNLVLLPKPPGVHFNLFKCKDCGHESLSHAILGKWYQ